MQDDIVQRHVYTHTHGSTAAESVRIYLRSMQAFSLHTGFLEAVWCICGVGVDGEFGYVVQQRTTSGLDKVPRMIFVAEKYRCCGWRLCRWHSHWHVESALLVQWS